eukprot:3279247-Pyramimonas_sp.AAC.1
MSGAWAPWPQDLARSRSTSGANAWAHQGPRPPTGRYFEGMSRLFFGENARGAKMRQRRVVA